MMLKNIFIFVLKDKMHITTYLMMMQDNECIHFRFRNKLQFSTAEMNSCNYLCKAQINEYPYKSFRRKLRKMQKIILSLK